MHYRENVRQFLMTQILTGPNKPTALKDSDSLVNSGLVNSLSIVEIITYLEKSFGLDVGDGEINILDFDSIDQICQLLERKGAVGRVASSAQL